MKKKYFIIILLMVIMCTGCNGTITREIRESGFSVSDSLIECPILVNKNHDDGTYDKVRFLSDYFAISEAGNIYELSLGGLYSNDMNCRKGGKDIKVKAIYNNMVVRDNNGDFYYLFGNNDVAAYSKVEKEDQFYSLYKILLGEDVVKSVVVNANSYNYYVLKEDGNVYNYILDYDRTTGVYSLVKDDEIVYSKSKFNGSIIDFEYSGQTLGTYVRSEDGYYRMMCTNLKECSKYVDVACEFEMKKDEAMSKHSDRIVGFSGTTLITDYGRVFSVSG